ncbi:MAG TPA: HRDC domain-containing protein, partial [Vicinamibacteria bacterium]|nr:HRDC domain-containing protein [Vicinamibacteria bacterium]
STDDPAFRQLLGEAEGARAIVIDTESDSLYHFHQKVCLIQVATEAKSSYLIDPLEGFPVEALRGLFEDRGLTKVFHGADYDIALLKAKAGIAVRNIYDTMIAARFLGRTEVGLQATLRDELGIVISKGNQKDDWSARPLSDEQLQYALTDVNHLLDVVAKQRAALEEKGRLHWVQEECAALESLNGLPEKTDPREVFRDVKGVAALPPRGLSIFRELIACREHIASELDLPPFRVAVNEALLSLAHTEKDGGKEAVLNNIRRREYADRFHKAVIRGMQVPEAELPKLERGRRIELPLAQQRRVAALKEWRKAAAARIGLELSLVIPQRLIDKIAEANPGSIEDLSAIEGLRRWRVEAFGGEILRAIGKP